MELTQETNNRNRVVYWLFLVAVMAGLYCTTWVNYLLFHSIVELFSIIVAASVFIITWNSLKYLKNPYLIMVGVSSLFIAVLDLLHTLTYKGMPMFADRGYYATQLWIAARYLESITLLAAFIFLCTGRGVRARSLFVGYLAVTSLLVLSIFHWNTFPACFVDGKGLTGFKIYSEYLICLILVASLILLVKNGDRFSPSVRRLLVLSIVCTIVSELAFTVYIDTYGISNLVGHYFKLFSFMIIYKAIVSTGLEEPYQLIFKELVETNRALQEEITLRKQVEAALKEKEEKLQASYDELQAQSEELQAQSEELQAQSEELQAQSDELQLRNAELARLWEKSRRSEEALQKLNEVLDKRVAERTRELREKDHLLIQQSRLAAMGEMINNIAHQWRQPLNSLGLLIQEIPLLVELGEVDEASVMRNSEMSMALIKHMSRTIDDFRNFFKPNKEKVLFRVNDEIDRTLSLIAGSLQGKEIAVEVAAKEDPSVVGYPNEFSQVLINIVMNARDALLERGVDTPKIMITLDKEEEKAVVTIADNAGGVPDEIMEKIFAPYFTTKGPQEGTGVGLFMSKNIIEKNMGGILTVRNNDEGAEFRIVV